MFRIEHMFDAQVASIFHVMIGLDPLGDFQAVSGLGRTVEPFSYQEGGRNSSPHMLFGTARYGQCRLEWGITIRSALYDWIHAVELGQSYRRQIFITQFSRSMVPLRLYHLWNAWPTRWEAAKLDANSNAVDTEEIEVVFEGLGMVTNPITILDAFVTGTSEGTPTPVWTQVGELELPPAEVTERVDLDTVLARGIDTHKVWKYGRFGKLGAGAEEYGTVHVEHEEYKRKEWEFRFVSTSGTSTREEREFVFVSASERTERKEPEFVFIPSGGGQ